MAARYNVLFLCNENSARSIFAEALLNHKGREHFHDYSAGPAPKDFIYPQVLRQLESVHLPTRGLRSKSIREFAKSGAPDMDLIFSTSKEACPLWEGRQITGQWNVPDPTVAKGAPDEIERAFRDAFSILQRRIDLFVCLPLDGVCSLAIQRRKRAA